jgi:hypothetical protein
MKKSKFQKSLSVSLPIAVYDKIKELSDVREVSMGEIAREILANSKLIKKEDNSHVVKQTD